MIPFRPRQSTRPRLCTFRGPNGRRVRYTIRLPPQSLAACPLVISLHYRWESGGLVPRGLGGKLLEDLVEPALRDLHAILVAPDCPGRDWIDPLSEQAVLALVDEIERHHPVDRSRVIVVGFSLGAAGSWHMARRHPDIFSAAVAVAGTPPPDSGSASATPAVYAINSRADTAASVEATADAINELRRRGANAEVLVLDAVRHLETTLFIEAMSRAVPWLEGVWRSAPAVTPRFDSTTRRDLVGKPRGDVRQLGGRPRVEDVRAQFSDAAQLLVLCARTASSPAIDARMAMLAARPVDWEGVFGLAERHGTTQLLYLHVNRLARASVPTKVLERQQRIFRDTYLRNGLMSHELIRLCRLFETRGIRAIPFKGPILATSVYGDIGSRRFVDLDIVVSAADVSRAAGVLVEEGYRFVLETDADFEDKHHGFVHDDLNVTVELQPAMGNLDFRFPLDTPDRWRSLEPVTLGQATLLTFGPADHFIVLAVHGCKHGWSRLMWIVDIAEFVRTHADSNWPRILEHARSAGAARMVAVALALTRDVLETPLPHPALNTAADDPLAQRLAAGMAGHLFLDVPFTRFEMMQMYLEMKDSWIDRVRFYLHCTGVDLDPDLQGSAPASFRLAYDLLVRLRKLVKLGLPMRARETILQWLKQV